MDAKMDDKADEVDAAVPELTTASTVETEHAQAAHTRVDFSSAAAFRKTMSSRVRTTFTKRFLLCLLAGQILSWCITGSNTLTTELAIRGFNAPTTQTIFVYLSLCLVYTPYTIYRYGIKGWGTLLWKDGWKYAFLAACDVEGNFLVVKGFQYSNLLSCQLLNSWAIPCCMFFSWVLMRTKFNWKQILGVLVCMSGLGLLVASDTLTGKDYEAANMLKGDLFMIAGATLYGFTNACEESLVKKRPLFEVVGQIGFWGVIWSSIQSSALEHNTWYEITWDGSVAGFIVAYTACLFILYTLAPLLYRSASSVFYNLSLLTSSFFGLLIGLALFGYRPYFLYFIAFVIVIVGLIGYFWFSPEDGESAIEVTRPAYANQVDSEADQHVAGLGIGGLVKGRKMESAV